MFIKAIIDSEVVYTSNWYRIGLRSGDSARQWKLRQWTCDNGVQRAIVEDGQITTSRTTFSRNKGQFYISTEEFYNITLIFSPEVLETGN